MQLLQVWPALALTVVNKCMHMQRKQILENKLYRDQNTRKNTQDVSRRMVRLCVNLAIRLQRRINNLHVRNNQNQLAHLPVFDLNTLWP